LITGPFRCISLSSQPVGHTHETAISTPSVSSTASSRNGTEDAENLVATEVALLQARHRNQVSCLQQAERI
jgi:hypothetical protein